MNETPVMLAEWSWILVAVQIGLLMGMSHLTQPLLGPPIEITRPAPKLALLPPLIIWFGIGEFSKVVIIVLALFPILSISAMQAVKGMPRRKIQAAQSLGAGRWTIFRRVVSPASLPGIFTAIRIGPPCWSARRWSRPATESHGWR